MPELPEVETTRRSLSQPLQGQTVVAVRMGKPLRWPLGVEAGRLVGHQIGALVRRGKYLWMPLHHAAGSGGLLLHLGMSGALVWHASARAPGGVLPAPGPHDHFDLITEAGLLRLTDPRRFGAVVWSGSITLDPAKTLLSRLGPEPFDPGLDAASFHAALRQHRSAVKGVLLSGRVLVGAGNIYACEALFDAGIEPRMRADRISAPRAARLLAALRAVLARAIDAGGTTLRDYRNADGDAGQFQHETRVYGREGLPCRVCAAPVRRVVQGQRSTFFCPRCQRR
jgi:formamidopyrimidine-DNA glycosylase